MKQAILILMLALAFTSCLKEGSDGCPDYIKLTFLHEKSVGGYDEAIGNDVHLRIYKDNVLHSSGIIPYDDIKGGKEYRIRKEVTGDIDIVAWAVPAGEDFVGEIPAPAEDKSKKGEMLLMQSTTRSTSYQSMGHLYLGTFNYYDTDIAQEVDIKVPMNSCICQFTATLQAVAEIYTPGQEEQVWIEIYGTKSEMDLDFNPQGEDAIVPIDLLSNGEDTVLRSEMHGLLPSTEDQYISVQVYKGEKKMLAINTDFQARPGDIIHLEIYSTAVILHVNDWRVFIEDVEWI